MPPLKHPKKTLLQDTRRDNGYVLNSISLKLCKPRATIVAHGSHKPIGIYIRGLLLHKFLLVLEDICGVESVKKLSCSVCL